MMTNTISMYLMFGIAAIIFVILLLNLYVDLRTWHFEEGYSQYILYLVIIIVFSGLGLYSKNQNYNTIQQSKHIPAKYKPNSQVLTDKSISKTFQYSDEIDADASEQTNVNRQVNLYLNSIKNLHDYKLKVDTYQAKESLLGSDTPYHQTVQLTRKNY